MIYITINAKGGTGKSTFANQILPTYLFLKNKKKITLKEVDDENKDCLILSDSNIIDAKIVLTSEISNLDSIFLDDNTDIIIDVGGNKTATIFMRELRDIEIDNNVVFCVPVTAGTQDVANAYDITNEIKKLNENANIIYILSNAKSENESDLKDEFLQYFGNKFLNTPFAINSKDYIVINFNSMINISKNFNKTFYDVAMGEENFWELAKQANKANNEDDKEYYLMMNRYLKNSKKYLKDLEENAFVNLDNILDKFSSNK